MKRFKRLALAACVILFALPVQTYGFQVRVSAYTNDPRCTKRIHPNTTASEHRITRKDYFHLIALSPQLARHYRYGDVFILKIGRDRYWVRYEDRMSSKIQGRSDIDFLLPTMKKCFKFGIHRGDLILIHRPRKRAILALRK